MATKEQWEIFRYVYEREESRYQNITDRGKVYLSLITLYVGAIAFKADFWFSQSLKDPWSTLLFALLLGLFLAALCATVAAMGIYSYEGITDPEEVIAGFGDTTPDNEDFFDDRIIDVAVATNRNSKTNDRRASLLSISSLLMVIGIVVHIALIASLTIGGK